MLWFYTILFLYRVLMRFVLELWVLYVCVRGLWVLYNFNPGLCILHYFVPRLWVLCFLFCSCTIFFLGCGFYTFLVPWLWVLCIFVLVLWVLYDLVHGLCVRYNFCSWVVWLVPLFSGVWVLYVFVPDCVSYTFLFVCLVWFWVGFFLGGGSDVLTLWNLYTYWILGFESFKKHGETLLVFEIRQ